MGPGQRTIAVPIQRHLRTIILLLGSNNPNRLPKLMTAGTSVTATATATAMPIAAGIPMVWK
ncbi:Uncharacterised protein [Mycobacteroides abscessus subsp. abscessus]|nr:Uncharacterised protein [Mycobacteroides abscessus subsp. abscessus]